MFKKFYCLLFIFILLLNNISKSKNNAPTEDNISPEPNNILSEKDNEIEDLKSKIKILENKIKVLENNKNNKPQSAKTKNTSTATPKNSIQDKKSLKVGLALSGGGAKGLVHVGVLKELERNNVKIDYITGTSIGAVIGALYSVGYTPDEIAIYLKSVNWSSLPSVNRNEILVPLERKFNKFDYMVTLRYDKKFKFSMPKAFIDDEYIYFKLKNALSRFKNTDNFKDTKIPLGVVATDLNTGKSVTLKDGDIARAVAASSAIPTIFEPVEIDNRLYVDGMISQNLPIQAAFDMGADVVIGSNVGNILKDNEDFNIVGVINQLMAIPSASSTEDQKKLAAILISPDMSNYSAIDNISNEVLITIGEESARQKLAAINSLPKLDTPKEVIDRDSHIYIREMVFLGNLSPEKLDILKSMLNPLMNKNITYLNLEKNIMKIYGLDFINNIYFRVEKDVLYVDATVNPSNLLGVGVNYRTDYGSTLNIGTEFSSVGKLGHSTFVNLRLGDYLGFEIKNFFYYGSSNKIGIFANLIIRESPFYLYDDRKKIAEFTINTAKLEFGITTQINNKIFLTYGIDTGYVQLEQKINTNIPYIQSSEYSKNINNTFLKITYDNLNSIKHPTSGYKIDFNYIWGGNFGKSSTNYYGAMYLIDGYIPIKENITLKYGLYGGIISGKNLYLDQYINIGGINDYIDNKEFSFLGYRTHQKLVKQFIAGRIGLEKEFLKNLYLGANWNFGAFEDLNNVSGKFKKSNMWKKPVNGFGLNALYESFIGPIEFSVSTDEKWDKITTQVSVGYQF
ncbi:MAG: patatin-like phospholipase family protein [Fusobacteriaceae bacterium]|jgi:NTE family protein|nr:patatin-like phospholipase family protein [Fusobacteriaceae bacterium]